MQTHEKFMAALIAVAVAALLTLPHWVDAIDWPEWKHDAPAPAAVERVRTPAPPLPPHDPASFARVVRTAHYEIASNASADETQRAAASLEGLHAAWFAEFGAIARRTPPAQLQVALYRDRADFQAHDASRAWAQGYYRRPVAHAWYDAQAANPSHWLLHEATHQLDAEVGGFAGAPWLEEGLATDFATSRVVDGELRVGDIDFDAYPLRWLDQFAPSGDLQRDVATRRVIPLQELIDSDGPAFRADVNRYYFGYWSLAHYLRHGENGKYAAAFRQLLTGAGSLEAFERQVGPVQSLQAAWYAHLQAQVQAHREYVAQARHGTAAP